MMNISQLCLRVGCLGFLLSSSCSVSAAQTGDSVNFNFTGRLVQQSFCIVNNDQVINVPFGNVGINKVESGRYIKDVNYQLDCKGAAPGATVNMLIKASPSAWDAMAAGTDIAGLGVRFLLEKTPMALNTAMPIDSNTPPHLQVQLVKDPSIELTEQPFTAIGTLLVTYY